METQVECLLSGRPQVVEPGAGRPEAAFALERTAAQLARTLSRRARSAAERDRAERAGAARDVTELVRSRSALRMDVKVAPPQAFPFGAYIAVAEVDADLGTVRLLRLVAPRANRRAAMLP